MNIENSQTNESNKFFYEFTDKLNLKNPNKTMALANLTFTIHEKTLNLHIKTMNLRFLLQLGMIILVCLMDPILYLIYKMILNISFSNMKL